MRNQIDPKPLVKVSDFLLTLDDERCAKQEELGSPFVNPWYMTPEHRRGDLLDHRSDIYAVGCIMFEAFSGHMLSDIFEPEKLPRFQSEIPSIGARTNQASAKL